MRRGGEMRERGVEVEGEMRQMRERGRDEKMGER